MNELRIATRGSPLAMWQAEHVRSLLRGLGIGGPISLLVLKTQGDLILDRPLSAVGGKGLFTKEIEAALLDGRADLAVHSAKDLPWDLPAGLTLAAIPPRADVRDALIVRPGLTARMPEQRGPLLGLPRAVRVGTSSLRRASQLRHLRPDLQIVPLRGNVDTRLRRVQSGELDAAVLASAGLSRLGLAEHISEYLDPREILPACGQGALGIECRSDDQSLLSALHRLADAEATAAVQAERAFSRRLGGSCHTPIGALATCAINDSLLTIRGMVGSLDGTRILRAERTGPLDRPVELGIQLADALLAQGALALLGEALGEAREPAGLGAA